MRKTISWTEIRRQPDLKRLQEGFAQLSGTSLWVLEEGQSVDARSLTHGETEDFLTAADRMVSNMGERASYAELVYGEETFYIGRQPILVNGERQGDYAFMRMKTEHITSEMFAWQIRCFMELLEGYISRESKIFSLQESLKSHQEIERNMEVEKAKLQLENDFDELTGVHSRSYFYKQLDIMDKREDLLPISLIVGDVNNLKFTNDLFGHRHGDYLLCRIADVLKAQAERLKEEIGKEVIIARCGGDEFNILMPNAQRRDANYYCHLVREALKKENGLCMKPSISLGSAKKTEIEQSLNRLLETADAKMYAAKREYKQNLDQFEEMMEVLFARRYLSRSQVEKKMDMMVQFAEFLGWTEATTGKCRNLIRYQDVGLTIVPERIYRKKGAYTDREWREIKKHPQLGMKLMLIRPDLAPISDMMYQTHENYDGSGWPRGISGDAISLEVMAVRIVTEFLNLSEECSFSEACAYIKEGSGKLFEPEMAEDFIHFVSRK
jgi:diguanylate cyclase (GGDEF)-like protein